MAYTEYLDIVIRNQGKLDALDKQIKGIRDNLEAINAGPAGTGERPSSAALRGAGANAFDRRAQNQIDRQTRLASTRSRRAESVADGVDGLSRRVSQRINRIEGLIDKLAGALGAADDLPRPGGKRKRVPVRGASNPNLITGYADVPAGGGRPPRPPRRPPGGGGGALPPGGGLPEDPLREALLQSRLNAVNRQFKGQVVKSRLVSGSAAEEVQGIIEKWQQLGGVQSRNLQLLQAYYRELRALNAEQVQVRETDNARQRGRGSRALLQGRLDSLVNDPLLPQAQRERLQAEGPKRLKAQQEALKSGNRAEATQQQRLLGLTLDRAQQLVAAAKREEVRARAPQQARIQANKAQKLGRLANEIEIPRNTPLGQELFQQAATIAAEAGKQEKALRAAANDSKITSSYVKQLTGNVNELSSQFQTLKTRAQPLQQAAKDAASQAKADQQEGLRIGRLNSTPLSAAKDIPGSKAFREARQREFDAQVRENERRSRAAASLARQRQREEDAAARRAESERKTSIRNAVSSPVGGGEAFAGSPLQLESIKRRIRQSDALRRNISTERNVLQGLAENPALSDAQRAQASNAVKSAETAIARIKAGQTVQDKSALQLAQDELKVLQSQTKELKQQVSASNAKAKAQREEISFGAFGRRVKQTLSGKGGVDDFENLALGAGFPLLFGGGPGTVAGGVLGSFIGKGFGGQILGGAIGQIVDDLIASTAKLGNALNILTGDFDALREAGIKISPRLQATVSEQRQAGDFQGAAETIRRDLAIRTGDVNINTGAAGEGLKAATTSVNALSTAWDELRQSFAVGLSVNAAPLITTLSGVLKIVNGLLVGLNAINASGFQGKTLDIATGGAAGIVGKANELSGNPIGKFYEKASAAINQATGEYQKQQAELQSINNELNKQLEIQDELNKKRTASLGLTGGNKQRAEESIAAIERKNALDERLAEIKKTAKGDPSQQLALEQRKFNEAEVQERLQAQFRIAEAERAAFRERQDRERALARETEGLIRRREDLAQAQVEQARAEFDLQRQIADFRIRAEDQIASKRADLIRQELEIAKIRGQIEDSQISRSFDPQIEAAPNDQAAKILSAAKAEALARKDLERTVRDGRVETALRVDQIERQSRQEQRALENDRIALERQRDSVIRGRISIERQTEDLKRETADYQLNVQRQIEDSALRVAAEQRAAAAGLLGGTAATGGLASAIDAIGGAYQFRGTTLQGNKKPGDYQSDPRENFFFDKRPELIDRAKQRINSLTPADKAALAYTVLTEAGPTNLGKQEVAANLLVRSAALGNAPISAVAKQPGQYAGVNGVGRIELESAAAGRKRFGSRYDAAMELLFGGASAMPRAAMLGQPIEYLTGDRSSSGYRADHGGQNYHEHIAYRTKQERDAAMALLKANGIKIGSVDRPGDKGYHGSGLAFDVPASQVAPGMEQQLSRRVRAILGIQEGRPSSAPLPGIGVGTAPFDLKAQAARDKELQRQRQRAEEDLRRETLKAREQDTLRAIVDEDSLVRKREEFTLATRIADAGLKSTEAEQKLLELRISNTREQEILVETVAKLGPINAERQAALDKGLARLREELSIQEGLLKIEQKRQTLQELVNTQREIQNFAAGIDAGFGVGTQASSAYANTLSRTGSSEDARRQADAVRTLTLLQQTVQDAQSIGGSIGDGVRNALIASVSGGDIRQAFAAMFATIGNTLIQSALRPIEESITNAAFNLLRPNLNAEQASVKASIAASQQELAAIKLNVAADALIAAANAMNFGKVSSQGFNVGGKGIVGSLVESIFSGPGPVSFPSTGLSESLITDIFSGKIGGFFAAGGSPPIGMPSVVGEQGPEISVARGLSTIIPNETSSRLWDSLSSPGAPAEQGGGEQGGSISFDGPVLEFDSTRYIRQDDVPGIVDRAVKQSYAFQRSRMRDSPADRRAFGMR